MPLEGNYYLPFFSAVADMLLYSTSLTAVLLLYTDYRCHYYLLLCTVGWVAFFFGWFFCCRGE